MKLQILKQARVNLQVELIQLKENLEYIKKECGGLKTNLELKVMNCIVGAREKEIEDLQAKIACLNLWITELEGQDAENI